MPNNFMTLNSFLRAHFFFFLTALYLDSTPRENRIRTGQASKRLVQRYLNSVNVSDTEASATEGEDSEEGDKQIVQFKYDPKFIQAGEEFFTAPEVGAELLNARAQARAERKLFASKMTPAQREERDLARRRRRVALTAKRARQNERIKAIIAQESEKLDLPIDVLTARLAASGRDSDLAHTFSGVGTGPAQSGFNATQIVHTGDLSYEGLAVEDYFSLIDPVAKAVLKRAFHTSFFNSLDILLTMLKLRVVSFKYGAQENHGDQYAVPETGSNDEFVGVTLSSLPVADWYATFQKYFVTGEGDWNLVGEHDMQEEDISESKNTPLHIALPFPSTFFVHIDNPKVANATAPRACRRVFVQCADLYGTRILKSLATFHQLDLVQVDEMQALVFAQAVKSQTISSNEILSGEEKRVGAQLTTPIFEITPRLTKGNGSVFVPHTFSLRTFLKKMSPESQ